MTSNISNLDYYSKGINLTDHTTISVFFADLVSTRYRKDIYQNWLSLLGKYEMSTLIPLVNAWHWTYYFTLFLFYSVSSFKASFGGILGLLLGFSFISVFELIYFFTIRVFFDRSKANMNIADSGSEN